MEIARAVVLVAHGGFGQRSGSYTFTGFGISETADLGTVTRDVTDTMPVREIQAVIR